MNLPDTEVTSARHSATVAQLVAAAALLVGGLVHLQLYLDGYRSLPDPNLGRSFVLNGVASVVVAAALVLRRDKLIRLAGLGIILGTLTAFTMSRRGDGVFGLRESGLEPSPQALIALAAELVALVALAATFLNGLGGTPALPRRAAAGLAVAFVATGIGGAMFWASSPTSAVAAATAPGNVTIADFAFDAPTVDVTTGSTLTWTNADGFAHSVVSSDGSFESERLATGASFTHTFDAAGSFTYICGIHPSMTGTVVVTG